ACPEKSGKKKGEYFFATHPPAKPARAARASQISRLMVASTAVLESTGFSPLPSSALAEGLHAAGVSRLHLYKIRAKEKHWRTQGEKTDPAAPSRARALRRLDGG